MVGDSPATCVARVRSVGVSRVRPRLYRSAPRPQRTLVEPAADAGLGLVECRPAVASSHLDLGRSAAGFFGQLDGWLHLLGMVAVRAVMALTH